MKAIANIKVCQKPIYATLNSFFLIFFSPYSQTEKKFNFEPDDKVIWNWNCENYFKEEEKKRYFSCFNIPLAFFIL